MSNNETPVADQANLSDIIAGLPDPITRPGNLVERTINGSVIRKPRYWWQSFDLAYGQMSAANFPLNAMTDFIDKMTEGSMTIDGLRIFGIRWGVDVSSFFGGGGGGTGATRAERIQSLAARILNDSRTLGLNLGNEKIMYLATVAEKLNFSEDQVRDQILSNVDWNTLEGGDLKAQVDTIRAMAKNYLIPIDENAVRDYSLRVSSGELSQEGLTNIFRTQSLAANPWAKVALDQNITPADLLKGHQQYVAQSLEIDPSQVDLTDNNYINMMTVKDQAGNTRVATLGELRSNVRKDARWAQTQQAQSLGANMANMVAKIFGRSSF